MASLNRERLTQHYYWLRQAYMVLSASRGKSAKIAAAHLRDMAVDIEGCIGQVDSQPAVTWAPNGSGK